VWYVVLRGTCTVGRSFLFFYLQCTVLALPRAYCVIEKASMLVINIPKTPCSNLGFNVGCPSCFLGGFSPPPHFLLLNSSKFLRSAVSKLLISLQVLNNSLSATSFDALLNKTRFFLRTPIQLIVLFVMLFVCYILVTVAAGHSPPLPGATGWTVRDRIPVRTRFSARPDRPCVPPTLL